MTRWGTGALLSTLMALTAGGAAADVAGGIRLPGCEPDPELLAAIEEPGDLAARCGGEAGCWRDGVARARSLRDRYPEHYDAHRAYVVDARAAARWLGAESLAAPRAEYAALAANDPESPAYAHLHAQLSLDGAEYTARIDELAARHPDYPWAHLSRALLARPDAAAERAAAAAASFARFAALCPQRVAEQVRALEALRAPELVRAHAGELRRRALERGDAEALARLWPLTLEAAAESEAARERETIGRELAALEASGAGATLDGLQALRRGAELLGDAALRGRAEERLLSGFPCTDPAARLRAEQLRTRHPLPEAATDEARGTWRAAVLAELERTLARCPDDEAALRAQVSLLAEAPRERDAELLAAIERYRALPVHRLEASPSPAGWLATLLIERRLGLDRVPALLAEDAADARADYERERAAAPAQAEPRHAFRRRQLLRLEVQLALAKGDLAAARARLDELAAETAAAPGGGRAEGAPGLGIFPDERTWLDLLEARWATAAGQPERALATLARLLPDATLGPAAREEGEPAWRAARGSAEGFDAWIAELTAGERRWSGWRALDRPLPDAALGTLEGERWDTAALGGRTALILVWTTWCTACVEQLDALEQLAAALGERADVQLLALNADRLNTRLIPFLGDHQLAADLVVGGDALPPDAVAALPTAWIVAPSGRIVAEATGFDGDAAGWVAATRAELERVAGPPPPVAP